MKPWVLAPSPPTQVQILLSFASHRLAVDSHDTGIAKKRGATILRLVEFLRHFHEQARAAARAAAAADSSGDSGTQRDASLWH